MTLYCEFNSKDFKTAYDARIRLLFLRQFEESQKELVDYLNSNYEFTLDVLTDLSGCLKAATEEQYDLLLIDSRDLHFDLGEAVEKFKGRSNDMAVILLTEETSRSHEIEYLNQGVDCVMTAPLNGPLLLARIKAIMRWRKPNASRSYQIGPFEFNMETKCLSAHECGDIKMTDKEALVLKFLLSRKGEIVTRTDLLRHVWGYSSTANTHTVETHIYRVRKKIGRLLDGKSVIITENGGYRLADETYIA